MKQTNEFEMDLERKKERERGERVKRILPIDE